VKHACLSVHRGLRVPLAGIAGVDAELGSWTAKQPVVLLHPRTALIAALATALCLAAFSPATSEPLRISHCVGGLEAEAVELMAEAFTEASGSPTRVNAEDEAETYGRLIEQQDRDRPDVLLTYAQRIPFLADAGRIVPLDDHVSPPPWGDFIAGVLDSVTYRGSRWAIPIEANPYGLFCNVTLFHEAGIQQPPQTWDETLEAAVKLTADTDGDGKTDRWGYTQCAFQLPLVLFAYGCDYISEDGTDAGFNNEAALDAMRLYVRLRRLSPSVNFERGDIGMKVSVLDNLQRYAHLDYVVAGLPRGHRKVNLFGGSSGVLSLTVVAGPRQEEALEFVRFWLRPDVSLRWATSSNNIALRRSVLDSWAYRRYLRQWPQVNALVEELPYCRPRPCRRAYAEISAAMAQLSNEAVDRPNPSDAELKTLLDAAAARVCRALAAERTQ
jgi:ABC-type glycerol-3-phosphate transport system substrate-binding protein